MASDLGMWLRRDPPGSLDGTSLYCICGDNSVTRQDPLGLDWHPIDYLPVIAVWQCGQCVPYVSMEPTDALGLPDPCGFDVASSPGYSEHTAVCYQMMITWIPLARGHTAFALGLETWVSECRAGEQCRVSRNLTFTAGSCPGSSVKFRGYKYQLPMQGTGPGVTSSNDCGKSDVEIATFTTPGGWTIVKSLRIGCSKCD